MEEMVFFPANFMLQTHHREEDNDNDDDDQPHMTTSLTPPNILPPQDFHGGVGSFLGKRSSSSSMSFPSPGRIHDEDQLLANNGDHDLSDEDEDDEGSQLGGGGGGGEKKRRLNNEQMKTLEKNFELGNKLDPDRKLKLARALGLQPRQIVIWFQNRRARWKTKQLEKDFDQLKRHFQSIQAENDSLQSQNNQLQSEILALKNREPTESINLNKETEGSCSNPSENNSDIKPSDTNSRRTTPPAIDSHPNIITSRPLFPASHSIIRPPSHAAQLLFQGNNNNNNNNSSSARPELQCHKIDPHQTVKEESFRNMFCGIDDQTGFWPWLEQQHLN